MPQVRHPPSRDVWRFCMDRLRALQGPGVRERDLARLLGFEHSRAVRWKEGQLYLDRAEHLLRLADALDVDPMLLVRIAAGQMSAADAQRQLARPAVPPAARERSRAEASAEVAAPSVLLLSADREAELALSEALADHPEVSKLVAVTLPGAMVLAERHRPELVFVDLGAASVHAFEALHVLAGLTTRSQRRPRVVCATAGLTDDIERPALMAGAAAVGLLPMDAQFFAAEIRRLEDRSAQGRRR